MIEKAKKPNAGQFKKKTAIAEAEVQVSSTEQVQQVEQEIVLPEPVQEVKKEVDMNGLVRDLMLNKYFHIFEKEARPIAEKMVREGSSTLHDVKWFLAPFERVQLAKELAEKYGLS
jgi:hypothetical protein